MIVTYNPDDSFVARFQHLATQVGNVIVVDNHSADAAVCMLTEAIATLNLTLIANSENLGIASALNIGLERATAAGFEWVLLLDQDTLPALDMVEILREAYDQFPDKHRLAVIGSNFKNPRTGQTRYSPEVTDGCCWREMEAVITSGSLVSICAFQEIGAYRSEYFIDCVDFEYCLRARSKGFKVIIAKKAGMWHAIGESTPRRLLWKTVHPTRYSPVRRYYMMRNNIALAKEYLYQEPRWTLRTLNSVLKSLLVLCVFEDQKWAKIKIATMGLLDGLLSDFRRKLG